MRGHETSRPDAEEMPGPVRTAAGATVEEVPGDRLRAILDGLFEGVWLVAEDGRTTYANAAMAELLGTTTAGLHGRDITEFLDPKVWDRVAAFLKRQRGHSGERMELRFRRADGGDLVGVVSGSPISTADDVFVGTMLHVSDPTGKRSVDAQVVQNQRLEAIGQFAGGIAHDFNNLLTSIQGYTQMAIDALAADDPIRHDLAQVIASSERASAITRKLLDFTRRQALQAVDVDPAIVIAGLLPILAPLLGDVVIALNVNANHAWVHIDATELEQVIMNLALNARDAMPSGGTVTISLHNLEGDHPERPDRDLTAGQFVRISVADTGIGMDDETKARIFDAFYTTKLDGQGTGFGLSTVFGIVAKSGGQVQVETGLGKGATFHVDLPRVRARSATKEAGPVEPGRRGSGAVLLAEDDRTVRRFARRSLESAGYTVFAASGGKGAINASDHWSSAIEVLITDVVMPGMHGSELAQVIRKSRPDIGIVLISGDNHHALAAVAELGPVEFLTKPFTSGDLSRAVGRAADAARGRAGQRSEGGAKEG